LQHNYSRALYLKLFVPARQNYNNSSKSATKSLKCKSAQKKFEPLPKEKISEISWVGVFMAKSHKKIKTSPTVYREVFIL